MGISRPHGGGRRSSSSSSSSTSRSSSLCRQLLPLLIEVQQALVYYMDNMAGNL